MTPTTTNTKADLEYRFVHLELPTMAEYEAMPVDQRDNMMLNWTTTGGIDSEHALQCRIIEWIHLMNLQGKAVGMQSLNRRFHQRATKCKTTVRDASSTLISAGLLRILQRGKMKGYAMVSSLNWTEREALWAAMDDQGEAQAQSDTFIALYI